MLKKNKLKLLFKSLFVQFGSVKTDEGIQLLWEEDTELIVGYNVYIEQEQENGDIEYVPAPDGEYHSGETVFVIADGKCAEIRNAEAEQEQEVETEHQEENLENQENLEENQPEVEVEVEPEKPEFNAEQAIADIKAEYDAKINDFEQRLSDMRKQLDELLALPAEESAFSKETKLETNKAIFKSKNK